MHKPILFGKCVQSHYLEVLNVQSKRSHNNVSEIFYKHRMTFGKLYKQNNIPISNRECLGNVLSKQFYNLVCKICHPGLIS